MQGDGKVLVAGVYLAASNSQNTRVYRLTTSATHDAGFASDGIADFKLGLTDLVAPYTQETVVDLRALANGKIEVLGSSYNTDNNTPGNSLAALARLNANGALDTSFGSGGVARRATFDGDLASATAGVIRTDGSAVVAGDEQQGTDRTSFVGFSASGKTAFNVYATSAAKVGDTQSAAALADGRVAFATGYDRAFFVSPDGTVSNAVQPVAGAGYGTDAIAATSDGDLILADVSSPYVRVTEFDAGRASDPRPDDLPAAAVIDTAVDSEGGLHVAYFDVATKSLKYAYRNAQGYWGGIRTVDSTAGAGAAISIDTIMLKGKTYVGIGYYDATSGDVRLAVSSTLGQKIRHHHGRQPWQRRPQPHVPLHRRRRLRADLHRQDHRHARLFAQHRQGFRHRGRRHQGRRLDCEIHVRPQHPPPGRRVRQAGQHGVVRVQGQGHDLGRCPGESRHDRGRGGLRAPGNPVRRRQRGRAEGQLLRPRRGRSRADDLRPLCRGRQTLGHPDDRRQGRRRKLRRAHRPVLRTPRCTPWNKSSDTAYEYDYDRSSGTATPVPIATGGGQFLSVATDDYGTVYAYAYKDTTTGLTFVR